MVVVSGSTLPPPRREPRPITEESPDGAACAAVTYHAIVYIRVRLNIWFRSEFEPPIFKCELTENKVVNKPYVHYTIQ